jgi:hypothetical protein
MAPGATAEDTGVVVVPATVVGRHDRSGIEDPCPRPHDA